MNSCACDPGFYQYYRTRASGGAESYVPNSQTNQLFRLHAFYPSGSLEVLRDTPVVFTCDGMVLYSNQVVGAGTYAVPAGFLEQTGVPTCQYAATVYYQVNGAFDEAESTAYFKCAPCPEGQASPAPASDACQVCPAGKYQPDPGSAECLTCPLGTVSMGGSGACVPCPAGWHQVSAQACLPCPTGTAAGPAPSYACTTCPPNYWASEGSAECTACPALSTGLGGTDASGCWCQSGTYLEMAMSPMACLMCPAGQYAAFASTTCSACSTGSYSPTPGSAGCQPCPLGSIAPDGGASACTPCEAGNVSEPTRVSCSPCPLGYYCPPGEQAQRCPLGSLVSTTGLASIADCPLCPAGLVCPDILTSQACPPNTGSPAGSVSQAACECLPGFSCSYVTTTSAVFTLPMTPAQFENVKTDFINAVAASAGVDPKYVYIISVREVDRRRSLARSELHVRVSLHDAVALRGLSSRLLRRGLPRPLGRPHLERSHEVTARVAS
jgi:hypothetical protein